MLPRFVARTSGARRRVYIRVRVRVWPGAPLLQRVRCTASAPVSVVRGEHEGEIRIVCIFKHPRYGNVPPPPVSIYLMQRSWRPHVMAKKGLQNISEIASKLLQACLSIIS